MLEGESFTVKIRLFAAIENTAGIASLENGGLDQRADVPAASQLDPETILHCFSHERGTFVAELARDDQDSEDDPEEECVDGEERAVVEEESGTADEGSDEAKVCGDSGRDEFHTITELK